MDQKVTSNQICEVCGKPFAGRKSARFCSRGCFYESRKNRITVVCDNCGATVEKRASRSDWNRHFCCMSCYSEYKEKAEHGGWTQESRLKASASRKRIQGPCKPDNYERSMGDRIHRRIAAEKLGRPLCKGEVVHHINGDKHDNRPENLMVFASQREHVEYHNAHPDESGSGLNRKEAM